MKTSITKKAVLPLTLVVATILLGVIVLRSVQAVAPLSGAIFTTESACNGTNINIFADKDAVYLDGGPAHPGAAGLPPGNYYVKVTEPNGTLLGTSVGSANETPVQVAANGEFAVCYQLSAILIKASDGTPGYDDTTNGGGEYKVWISPTADFASQKTDNFKVKCEDCNGTPQQGKIEVVKFYDANANGVNDDGQPITGWKIRIQDGFDIFRFTSVSITVAPDDYIITESDPVESNWLHTTQNSVNISVVDQQTVKVEFGNVCLGPGGGMTLGFWSNKNGQALVDAGDLAALSVLNLRDTLGADFDPASYSVLRTWLLNATATNMAYMLSAQLAAMKLNVLNGKVNGSALVYSPALGFISINKLIDDANAELGLHATAYSGNSWRATQEALKNALDKANNNMNFVQARPCPFTF
ncbi:MAG TPA: hypothetical protein VFZ34_07320 [Blastocatellia bacterium]|nr:hypothetical protein [Blastocatellia bacterium]